MNAGQIVMMQLPGISVSADAQQTVALPENGTTGTFAGLLTTLVPAKESAGSKNGTPDSNVRPADDRPVVADASRMPEPEQLAGMMFAMTDAAMAGMPPRADIRGQDAANATPEVTISDARPQNVVTTVAAVPSGAAAVVDSRMPVAGSTGSVPGVMPVVRPDDAVMTIAEQAALARAVDMAEPGEQTEQKPDVTSLARPRTRDQQVIIPGLPGMQVQAAPMSMMAATPQPQQQQALPGNIPRDGVASSAAVAARAETVLERWQPVRMPAPIHTDAPDVNTPKHHEQQGRLDTVVMPQPISVQEQPMVKAAVAETVVPAAQPQGIVAQPSMSTARPEAQQQIAASAEKHDGLVESVATPPVAEQHDTPLAEASAAVPQLTTAGGEKATPLSREPRERMVSLTGNSPQPVSGPPVLTGQADEDISPAGDVPERPVAPPKETQPGVMAAVHRSGSAQPEIQPDASKRQPDPVDVQPVQKQSGAITRQAVMAVTEGESSNNVVQKAPDHAGENQPGMSVAHAATRQESPHVASLAAPAAPAEPLRSEPTDSIVRQVKDRLAAVEPKTGSEQIVLRLSPEHMGDLKLNLNMDGQRLKVEIVAENRTVRDALLQHADTLKESLARQNISMESFDVTFGGSSAGGFGRNQDGWKQQVWQRQQQVWTPPGKYGLAHNAPPPDMVARYQARGEHSMVDIHY